jgi:hypothetical protein
MTFPEEEGPAVGEAGAHAVVQAAQEAGVWTLGGGVECPEGEHRGATDGRVTDRVPGGKGGHGRVRDRGRAFTRRGVGLGRRDRRACRCAQEVRELLPDPTV